MPKRTQYLSLLNQYRRGWITLTELYTTSIGLGVSEERVAADIAETSTAKHGSSNKPPAPAPTINRETPARRP